MSRDVFILMLSKLHACLLRSSRPCLRDMLLRKYRYLRSLLCAPFKISALRIISLCNYHYSYFAEEINYFAQKRVFEFVQVAQQRAFCNRNFKTCRMSSLINLHFAKQDYALFVLRQKACIRGVILQVLLH